MNGRYESELRAFTLRGGKLREQTEDESSGDATTTSAKRVRPYKRGLLLEEREDPFQR